MRQAPLINVHRGLPLLLFFFSSIASDCSNANFVGFERCGARGGIREVTEIWIIELLAEDYCLGAFRAPTG